MVGDTRLLCQYGGRDWCRSAQPFEQCYDDGSGLARVQALDALRRERGITSQPVFDVNGVITAGLGNLFPTINGVIDQLEQ